MKKALLPLIPLLLLVSACSRRDPKAQVQAASKEPDPIAVKMAVAEARKIERSISVTGSLQPDESVVVSSEVGGRVSLVRTDFGQAVRKGDIVAEIDKTEYQIQLDRARASLAQALARIGLDPGQEEIRPESTPALRQANAQMDDARFKYENAAKLVKTGDVSQERFNELEKAYLARKAAVEAARDDLLTQLASVQALRAEVRLAQKRFNDATVRAPFDGSVTQRMISPGQYIKENTPILSVVKTWPLRLRVDIPESAVSSVKPGDSLTFSTEAVPNAQFHAIVRELNPSLEARSRSLTIEARLAENNPKLKSGMFVQVKLVTNRDASVVAVPKEALYTVAGLTKLFVIRNDRAIERRVPPGADLGGWIEVPSDLVSPGDKIAVSDVPSLTDGVKVRSKG